MAKSFLLYLLCLILCSASANITTQHLKDPETLVSNNTDFKLGFFSPKNSAKRYVGIWYNKQESDVPEVIWTANRDTPLTDTSGVLRTSDDGNLQLVDGQNNILWSSNVIDQRNSTVAQLLDTGNLVLLTNATGIIIWQSFEHQTDSLLPPVKFTIHENERNRTILRSSKSLSDPSSGRFAVSIYRRTHTEIFFWVGGKPYGRTGPWNGNILLGWPSMSLPSANGFSLLDEKHENTFYITYTLTNESYFEHLILNYDGNVICKKWDENSHKWMQLWQFPGNECEVYGKCGQFGNCNPKRHPICDCLKGFQPKNVDEWSTGNWTNGCIRRRPLQCNSTGDKPDGFLRLEHMKVPDNAGRIITQDQDECGNRCLEKCSCLAYAYHTAFGCMIWNESLIDIEILPGYGIDLFIRLAHSEFGETKKWIIAVMAIIGMVSVTAITYVARKKFLCKYGREVVSRKTSIRNLFKANGNQLENQELALLEFAELSVATNNFDERNKVGQGGFGPVYKGNLDNGQEIAVKRLSTASGQGLQELINEVVMISKLQHRNLVKLLGYCVEGEEKLLVYEFLPNKSLDALLFDPQSKNVLNWEKRFNIIKGICRGVLYLHRDSRLKIIHRDLKASNILLDEELNPKISDFGMARIFGGKQDQAKTLRVAGTYGYMSPEYAMEGRFSEKSDIFSLGVILLEIVRGQRNGDYIDGESLSLLSYAWQLWNDDNVLTLIDPTISDPCFHKEILKTIQVGLLCVQEIPEDRPNISTVISMLDNEVKDLPQPLQPGFTQRRICSTSEVPQDAQPIHSANLISVTSMSFR